MTLLKQTTASRVDDSLLCPENDEDLQTDCCSFSMTSGSLEKELQTLTLSDAKTVKGEHSCESGIATLSANYSVQNEETERADVHEHGELSASTKRDQPMTKTEECFQDNSETVTFSAEESVDNSHKKREEDDKISHCWDEMCESFPDKDGDTLLHLAVLQTVTHLGQLVRLLGLHGQVNCRNRLYQTPLHLAVLTANTKALALLRNLGASLCMQDCHGNTPLHTASLRNDPHALKVLLEGGGRQTVGAEGETLPSELVGRASARLKNAPLDTLREEEEDGEEVADDTDGVAVTEKLGTTDGGDGGTLSGRLEEGGPGRRREVEREVRVALCTKNYEGFTCVHLAVLHGDAELVALLLQHGADVNARDGKSGRTALHLAVDTPHPGFRVLTTLLLHPQLHINATNFAQQTALQLARGRHHLDLVDLLHMHGADWSDSVYGYYSSDSFSEEDAEEELCVPYDDLRVAGRLLTAARCN